MALGRRRSTFGLIHHSDRGSQYASDKYRKLIGKAHFTQSMSCEGECLNNASMDIRLLGNKNWYTASALERALRHRVAIFEYIEVFYNR